MTVAALAVDDLAENALTHHIAVSYTHLDVYKRQLPVHPQERRVLVLPRGKWQEKRNKMCIRDRSYDATNMRFAQGDVVTTIIKCARGETITLTLDTTLPRFYSRGFHVQDVYKRQRQAWMRH